MYRYRQEKMWRTGRSFFSAGRRGRRRRRERRGFLAGEISLDSKEVVEDKE